MSTVMRCIRIVVMSGIVACALSACAGSGEQKKTHFYVLAPLPATTQALTREQSQQEIGIDIAALRLPQYLQRPQIVTRTASNKLDLAEYHQWGGNLAKNLMQVTARNLARLLDTANITVFSRRPPKSPDVRVEIDVLQFERTPDSRVHLSAQWRLLTGRQATASVAMISDYQSEALTAPISMEATVQAMSELAGQMSKDIAQAIVDGRT